MQEMSEVGHERDFGHVLPPINIYTDPERSHSLLAGRLSSRNQYSHDPTTSRFPIGEYLADYYTMCSWVWFQCRYCTYAVPIDIMECARYELRQELRDARGFEYELSLECVEQEEKRKIGGELTISECKNENCPSKKTVEGKEDEEGENNTRKRKRSFG